MLITTPIKEADDKFVSSQGRGGMAKLCLKRKRENHAHALRIIYVGDDEATLNTAQEYTPDFRFGI